MKLTGEFKTMYEATRNDIFAFARLFGFKPTHQHRELLQAVQDGHKRICVKSGQGPGKTGSSVIIGLWRAWRNVDSRVVVTAPTMRQCKDVWLSEARKWVGRAHPLIQRIMKVYRSKIEIAGRPDWGVRLLTATTPEAAQGQHADQMTFIADEASGIEHGFWEQILGTLTNEDSLFLAIGNPNTRECAFFDCFNKLRDEWFPITFNAEESPDWLVAKDQHRLLEKLYGRDSDVYRVRVLGEFPTEDPNTIIPLDACQEVMVPGRMREFGVRGPEKIVAIDMARYGSDESVVVLRQGMSVVEMQVFVKREPLDVIDEAIHMAETWGWDRRGCLYVPDATGMGQGTLGHFYRQGLPVHEFHNGGRAERSNQFSNKISEAWFTLASLVRGRSISLPNDERLLEQLTTRQYVIRKDGRIEVESKDLYTKRGYPSPDRADAVVMSFYHALSASAQVGGMDSSGVYVGTGWQV